MLVIVNRPENNIFLEVFGSIWAVTSVFFANSQVEFKLEEL